MGHDYKDGHLSDAPEPGERGRYADHSSNWALHLISLNLCELRKILETICAHICAGQQSDNQAILHQIEQKVDKVMATTAEVIAKLDAAEAQAKKIRSEIQGVQTALDTANAEIVTLKELIAAGGQITPELVAAADRLGVALQEADDQIPDFKPTA